MFKVKPILGRVIIELEPIDEKVTDSGIIVEFADNKARQGTDRIGTVVAFDEAWYQSERARIEGIHHPGIKLGQRIFFQGAWQGEPFDLDGKKYHTMEGSDAALLLQKDSNVEVMPLASYK